MINKGWQSKFQYLWKFVLLISRQEVIGFLKFLRLPHINRGYLCGVDPRFVKIWCPGAEIQWIFFSQMMQFAFPLFNLVQVFHSWNKCKKIIEKNKSVMNFWKNDFLLLIDNWSVFLKNDTGLKNWLMIYMND